MNYQISPADLSQLPRILEIYAGARDFMARSGNPGQWGNRDPEESLLRQDIRRGSLYVLKTGDRIHGVFAFLRWEDPTYQYIEGAWHSTGPYGVIHRVAGDGSGGILKAAVAWAEQKAPVLRIDTHRDNLPMQRAIEARGFSYCGVIYTERGDPRLAFDRIREISPGEN